MATAQKVAGFKGLLKLLRDDYGYEGGETVDEVLAYAGEIELNIGTKAALIKAHKEYMRANVEPKEDGGLMIELQPEAAGDAGEDQKMDDEEPEDAEKSRKADRYKAANAQARLEKRLASIEERLKQRTPAVSVELPGEKEWKRRKSRWGSGFETAQDAKDFGDFIISQTSLRERFPDRAAKSRQDLEQRGFKANTTRFTADGAALVPDGFISDIWAFDNIYGIARDWGDVSPMTGTSDYRPKNDGVGGGFVHYWITEGTAPTLSDLEFTQIGLHSREGGILGQISRRLMENSAVNVGDFAARKINEIIAKSEDDAAFNGDGTSTYGKVNGILNQFGSTATDDSRSVTGGGTASAHTAAHLRSVIGKLPSRFRQGAAWYVPPLHRSVILDRLAPDFGQGITLKEVEGFGLMTMFLNFPVVEVEVMPGDIDAGSDRIDLLFGRLDAALMIGDKGGVSVDFNPHIYWDKGLIGVKGEHEVAINAHELGSETEGGPLVALYQT